MLSMLIMYSNVLLMCRQCRPKDHRFSLGDLEIVSPSVSDAPDSWPAEFPQPID